MDPAARLSKPNELTKKATRPLSREWTKGQREPLEDNAGIVSWKRGDGALRDIDELTDEGRCRERLKDGFGANEKALGAQVRHSGLQVGRQDFRRGGKE